MQFPPSRIERFKEGTFAILLKEFLGPLGCLIGSFLTFSNPIISLGTLTGVFILSGSLNYVMRKGKKGFPLILASIGTFIAITTHLPSDLSQTGVSSGTNGCPIEMIGESGQYILGGDSLEIKTANGNSRTFEFGKFYKIEDYPAIREIQIQEQRGVVLVQQDLGGYKSLSLPVEGCIEDDILLSLYLDIDDPSVNISISNPPQFKWY